MGPALLNTKNSPYYPLKQSNLLPGTSGKLLYVENDPDIQETVKLALESFSSFQVATTNQSSLAIAFRETWDLFLIEVATARAIDLSVYHKLKAHSKTRLCPIVLLTSRVMPQELAYLTQLDIAGIIPKPFDPLYLGQQILNLL